MKKEDIKIIGDLLRDALGEFKKEGDKQFDNVEENFRKAKTDVSGLTLLMVEHFTETQTNIERVGQEIKNLQGEVKGFTKTHELLDTQVAELRGEVKDLEKRIGALEHKLAH